MREIKSSKSKRGEEVLVPGETEYNTSIDVHKNGIEISDVLLEELNKLGFRNGRSKHTANNLK
jgi:LDH2 family malate/lactate/ureidoglycolate dehydrogenase